MNKNSDIDNFLGAPSFPDEDNNLSEQEKVNRLRHAQNEHRGHPRRDEQRVKLRQINISCPQAVSDDLSALSLRFGKTKRTLLEEAIKYLVKKYSLPRR